MWDNWARSLGQEDPLENTEYQSTPVFLSGKYHVQRHLVGYCPWSHNRVKQTLRIKTTAKKTPKTAANNNSNLCKCPIYKYSHIQRYWGLGLQYEFWRDTVWSITVNICNYLSLLPFFYVVPFSSPLSPFNLFSTGSFLPRVNILLLTTVLLLTTTTTVYYYCVRLC